MESLVSFFEFLFTSFFLVKGEKSKMVNKGFRLPGRKAVHAVKLFYTPSKTNGNKVADSLCGLAFYQNELQEQKEVSGYHHITCQSCLRSLGISPKYAKGIKVPLLSKSDFEKPVRDMKTDIPTFRTVSSPKYGIIHAVDITNPKISFCNSYDIKTDLLPDSIDEAALFNPGVSCYKCSSKLEKLGIPFHDRKFPHLTKMDLADKFVKSNTNEYFIVDMDLKRYFKEYLKIAVNKEYVQRPIITTSKSKILMICLTRINVALGVRSSKDNDQYAKSLLYSIYKQGFLNIYEGKKLEITMSVDKIVRDIEVK